MPRLKCNPHNWETFKIEVAKTLLKLLIEQKGRVANLKPNKVAEACLNSKPPIIVTVQTIAVMEEIIGNCIIEKRKKVYISKNDSNIKKTYKLYAYIVDIKCAYNAVLTYLADKLPFNKD